MHLLICLICTFPGRLAPNVRIGSGEILARQSIPDFLGNILGEILIKSLDSNILRCLYWCVKILEEFKQKLP